MDEFAKVSMLELDRSLTRILKSAQRMPVSVHRYGTPWVWVVSHDVWVKANRRLSGLPERHPLVALRRHVDAMLSSQDASVAALSDGSALGDHPGLLLRALVLRCVYGIQSDRFLDEQLRHNAMFASFVGLEQHEWESGALCAQLARLRGMPQAMALFARLLEGAPLERFSGELGLGARPSQGCPAALP